MTLAALARRLLVALVALVPALAEAGFAIVDEAGHQTLVSRGRLKIAPREGGVTIMLDVGRARMWVADPGRRVYWEGTIEQYCQEMRGAMSDAMAEMERHMAEQLKNMSPAQREQMEQMMKRMGRGGGAEAPAGPPPEVTVDRTNETDRIAGLSARKYRVVSNGQPYEEVWLTTDAALLRELDAGRAPDTLGRMSACMDARVAAQAPEATPEYRKLYAEGWPLKFVSLADPSRPGITVTRVEQRDIPEADFTLPAGYRAAPLMEVFGARGR